MLYCAFPFPLSFNKNITTLPGLAFYLLPFSWNVKVWDLSCGKDDGLIGGATILLFNNKMQLKTGKQKLRLWLGKQADGSFPTSTPGKVLVAGA